MQPALPRAYDAHGDLILAAQVLGSGQLGEPLVDVRYASRDGFLTPYLEGLIQRHRGEPGWKEKLVLAKKYSDLGDQRRAVTKELALEEAP